MKKLFILVVMVFALSEAGQAHYRNPFDTASFGRLKKLLLTTRSDSGKVLLYNQIAWKYVYAYPDSSLRYTNAGLKLAKNSRFAEVQSDLLACEALIYSSYGDYIRGFQLVFEERKLAETLRDGVMLAYAFLDISIMYETVEDYNTAITYGKKSLKCFNLLSNAQRKMYGSFSSGYLNEEGFFTFLGGCYMAINRLDSAFYYASRGYFLISKGHRPWPTPYLVLAKIYQMKGAYADALTLCKQAIKISVLVNDKIEWNIDMAVIYQNTGAIDSSIFYAKKGLLLSRTAHFPNHIADAGRLLAESYRRKHLTDSTLKYQDIMLAANDSVFSKEKIKQVQLFTFKEQQRQQELQATREKLNSRIRLYAVAAVAILLLAIGTILWRNNKKQKHINHLLGKQKEEISAQRDELEDKNRELEIETALERVRAMAMAMHASGDLTATASTIFTELRRLGIQLQRSGVALIDKETHKAQIYAATSSEYGDSVELSGWVMLNRNPVLVKAYESWINDEDYFPVLLGEELRTYYEQLQEGYTVLDWRIDRALYGYFLPFNDGLVYGWTEKPLDEKEIKLLKRFTSVVGLTFKRYLELQKLEANAQEAIKRASLDRIRAETASMRTRQDLERITPLIWNELTILGIPFVRCGVFIMDEQQSLIHSFLSTPDGKAIAAFNLSYDTSENFKIMVNNWRHKKSYIAHWEDQEFVQIAETLVKQGDIESKEQYLKTLPHGGVHLNFLPFLQGMLYVGNTEALSEDHINLIQTVAEAFSTAYARYEDFNKLEAAKQAVDNTLTQLKATQNKLIQSEKMASLGELTAGIAHEIQNPLNFVNNFSEVNAELIEEMQKELKNDNKEEAAVISEDIKQNLEKIRHHGKRADGIVKGMLEHSRASAGQKEPTDLNKLADEYLRLAYHGLRAKDKSFNAELITRFDEELPLANVIHQDIGRVLLNLFNNAFFATLEKAKVAEPDYRPTVELTTFTPPSGGFGVSVSDNGNGIPQKITDKVFQPFFTTKPTGQGTGLGLSISYDIIKAHGGEITLETKEGEGTKFIISLPA
jgi:signal transduction histidine kinase